MAELVFDECLKACFHLKTRNKKLWCKCAHEIACTFRKSSDSVEKMRDNFKETTEGIEIEIKELKEKLNSLKTTVEKTTREGWWLD